MSRASILALALLLAGCPKEEAAPQDDRLLKKLQAEKDRLAKTGDEPGKPPVPAVVPEPNPLAARAAMPDQPKTVPITGSPDFMVGKAACRVSSVETSHHVAGEKLSLTTDDYFVKVTLTGQVAGGGQLDLSQAKLVSGGTDYPIARDAQRLAGTRELSRAVAPDEKIEAILYFEAPLSAIAPGLKLVVAGGDGVSLQ